jgi:hypothetical protein
LLSWYQHGKFVQAKPHAGYGLVGADETPHAPNADWTFHTITDFPPTDPAANQRLLVLNSPQYCVGKLSGLEYWVRFVNEDYMLRPYRWVAKPHYSLISLGGQRESSGCSNECLEL